MKKNNMSFGNWLIFALLNGLVIYACFLFFPGTIVLGNATVSIFAAVVLAALVVTLFDSLLPWALASLKVKKLSLINRYIAYLLINALAVWLMSKLALVFGFGLSSKYAALSLGVTLTIVQYIYWENIKKKAN